MRLKGRQPGSGGEGNRDFAQGPEMGGTDFELERRGGVQTRRRGKRKGPMTNVDITRTSRGASRTSGDCTASSAGTEPNRFGQWMLVGPWDWPIQAGGQG